MVVLRRRSSAKIPAGGIWSVRASHGYLIQNVSEGVAWRTFLRTIEDAELLKGNAVMSKRISISPIRGG